MRPITQIKNAIEEPNLVSKAANRKANLVIILFSLIVFALISVLTRMQFGEATGLPWDVTLQPRLHAILNSITALCLLAGFFFVKRKQITAHRFCMLLATLCSGFFLISYVIYHGVTESTSFGGEGLIKGVYYFILLTHIVLAAVILPFILITLHRALTNQIEKHRKLAKYTFPLWLYVAITGVLVYLLISPYY